MSTTTERPTGNDHDPATGRHERFYRIRIRTLAGHRLNEEVLGTELVAAVTTQAVAEFRKRHQLEAGHYALTLPRLGHTTALDPTATLREVGVRAGDELVLISRAPHLDG